MNDATIVGTPPSLWSDPLILGFLGFGCGLVLGILLDVALIHAAGLRRQRYPIP